MVSAESDWETLLSKSPADCLDQLLQRTSRDQWLDSIYQWQRQLEVYHAELLVKFDRQLQQIPEVMADLAMQLDKLETRSINKRLGHLEQCHADLMSAFQQHGIMNDLRMFWEGEREKERRERETVEQEWNALCREMRHALSLRELDEAESSLRKLESFLLKHLSGDLKNQLELLRFDLIELIKAAE